MTPHFSIRRVGVASLVTIMALAGNACSTTTAKRTAKSEELSPKKEQVLYEWRGDEVPGKLAIRINLSEQHAYFTKGGVPVGWSYVATGKSGYSTSPGSYSISEKVVDKYSTIYGVIEDAEGNVIDGDARVGRESIPSGGRFVAAPMPYWMRLTSYGIGMHAGPIPNPGSPASHGCIRFPRGIAPTLYDQARIGTSVRITY